MRKILVTGGCGYIGSHTVLNLLQSGVDVCVIDNFSNSSEHVLQRIYEICGRMPKFIKGDITDAKFLENLFLNDSFESVIHFAGLKSVSESIRNPNRYHQNNVYGSLQLFSMMKKYDVNKIVFSSSASIYGIPSVLPIKESSPTNKVTNPYAASKKTIEDILQNIHNENKKWSIINLRYFNPIGAHESGLIGESPTNKPDNIMPLITQAAVGKLSKIKVYGNDYSTRDGTGVRDYVHIEDLADAHLKALEKTLQGSGIYNINIGTGMGYSVLDLIKSFEHASKLKIPYEVYPRREGDVAEIYADPSYANEILKWKAKRGLAEMCKDAWNWQKNNPNGYE